MLSRFKRCAPRAAGEANVLRHRARRELLRRVCRHAARRHSCSGVSSRRGLPRPVTPLAATAQVAAMSRPTRCTAVSPARVRSRHDRECAATEARPSTRHITLLLFLLLPCHIITLYIFAYYYFAIDAMPLMPSLTLFIITPPATPFHPPHYFPEIIFHAYSLMIRPLIHYRHQPTGRSVR